MPDVAATFLRWAGARSLLARGWWLVTSVYLVVVADLAPGELILLGTFQGITVVLAEVPAGVLADTVSRRLSLVLAHVVMGTGMAVTGLVTSFPALVATQCLWGLGWALSSGADVAWVTDELDRPDLIARVLAARARWELVGAAIGTVGLGLLAWATDLATVVVLAGAAMVALGGVVAVRFTEHGFEPTRDARWRASLTIARRGVALARRDREILVVLAATLLVNGAAEGYGRLLQRRLLDLGLPRATEPIVWFTGLGLLCLAFGAAALRVVEARIDGADVARRAYACACAFGVAGLLLLAHAPDAATAAAGVIFVTGIAFTITRTVADIWVNRRTTSDVRATVHSLLAQAENVGEIVFGLALAVVATRTSTTVTLTVTAALVGLAGAVALSPTPGSSTGSSREARPAAR